MWVRTEHPALLLYEGTEVPEDLVELVYTGFNLTDFGFAFLHQGFLVCELLWRERLLEHLRLTLRRCGTRGTVLSAFHCSAHEVTVIGGRERTVHVLLQRRV